MAVRTRSDSPAPKSEEPLMLTVTQAAWIGLACLLLVYAFLAWIVVMATSP